MGKKRQFTFQALLLTGVSFLLRAVGVSAQVIISQKIGTEAVGVSALIGGVGGFAVTLALSGIQLGTTRLVAEGLGKEQPSLIRKTLFCTFLYAAFFGTLSGGILFTGAPWISKLWLKDMRTVSSLKIMALTLPLASVGSCISGYFIAVRRVYKSATIQVFEEILRLGLTLLFLKRVGGGSLESALVALSVSGAIADAFSTAMLALLYKIDRRKHFPSSTSLDSARSPTFSKVNQKLLSVTLPVAVSAYARSGLLTLEHTLIPIGLQKFGLTHSAALSSYGALHSMALPIILFPSALLSSFASLLVPELTEANTRGQQDRIAGMMQRTFSMTLIFSIGVSGILLTFSEKLGIALYHNEEVANYIRLLAPLIPIMYFDHAVDAILKGLGEQLFSMKINIADALLSVLLVWLLIPRLGIGGYIITIYISEIFNAALSVTRLCNVRPFRAHLLSWMVKPLLCVIAAGVLVRALLHFLELNVQIIDLPITFAFYFSLSALLYFGLLCLTNTLSANDLRWIKTLWTE